VLNPCQKRAKRCAVGAKYVRPCAEFDRICSPLYLEDPGKHRISNDASETNSLNKLPFPRFSRIATGRYLAGRRRRASHKRQCRAGHKENRRATGAGRAREPATSKYRPESQPPDARQQTTAPNSAFHTSVAFIRDPFAASPQSAIDRTLFRDAPAAYSSNEGAARTLTRFSTSLKTTEESAMGKSIIEAPPNWLSKIIERVRADITKYIPFFERRQERDAIVAAIKDHPKGQPLAEHKNLPDVVWAALGVANYVERHIKADPQLRTASPAIQASCFIFHELGLEIPTAEE
jgi:hypothetical protein